MPSTADEVEACPLRSLYVFAIAKIRNLEDVFPRQALSTGRKVVFAITKMRKNRIQNDAVTGGQRRRT